MKFGFLKDENNSELKKVFKDNVKLKEIHIDTYQENPFVSSPTPFMLLLRTIEKNVVVENREDRLILKRNDGFKTYFMNILFSKIDECFFKDNEDCLEFVLNIQNIYYRLIVLN